MVCNGLIPQDVNANIKTDKGVLSEYGFGSVLSATAIVRLGVFEIMIPPL